MTDPVLCINCSSGSSQHQHQQQHQQQQQQQQQDQSHGWTLHEEDSGPDGERLVKIQLQDATTSTKKVGFRIDQGCQTANCIDDAEGQVGPKDEQIVLLKEELKKASVELAETLAMVKADNTATKKDLDLVAESPLNLFIQCFKQKYGLNVHPNDVAIFV
jgi:hypothetical protein